MSRVADLAGPQGRQATLVGGILGLAADAEALHQEFERVQPREVLLGIPFEDLDSVRATAGKESASEFEAGELDEEYLKRLAKFGPVQSPPPDLYEAYRLAEQAAAPVRAVDLGDEAYTEAYTRHVGLLEVLRSNRSQRRLPARKIDAADAEEFAQRWDRALYPTKGLRRVQELRAEAMAEAVEKTIATPSLALVPLPRMAAIVARLTQRGWSVRRGSAPHVP